MEDLIKNFIKYVKNNNLVKSDKKHIIPNNVLIDMFDLNKNKPLAYYNLIKHLYKHINTIIIYGTKQKTSYFRKII